MPKASLVPVSHALTEVLMESPEDNLCCRGYLFDVTRVISVAASTTVKVVLDLSALSSRSARILPLVLNATGGPVKISTYAVSAYTGGSAIAVNSLNPGKAISAQAVFKTGVTSAGVAGNDLREYILGTSGNPVTRAGGQGPNTRAYYPSADIILAEITNQDAVNTVQIGFSVCWAEEPA
jgi:hypothetical protein